MPIAVSGTFGLGFQIAANDQIFDFNCPSSPMSQF
jgi:hypothetical protein